MIYTEDSSSSLHARLGPNHGYSIEGDVALLHADVAVPFASEAAHQHWALQLWACDAPHLGGPITGVKVAEAALPVPSAPDTLRLDTEALARVPGGQRDYSMVLVLASSEPGSVDQVHDFANYPQRQRFITPHLEGSVGYRIDGDALVITADSVRNPRHEGNLSGSLSLELWAQREEYRGGALEGTLVASADLGRIEGQTTLESLERWLSFTLPPAGEWRMVLALREWVGPAGFVTRDYCNFAVPFTQPSATYEIPESAAPVVLAAAEVAAEHVETQPSEAVNEEPVQAATALENEPTEQEPVVQTAAAIEPAKEEPAVKAPVATEPAKQEPVVQAAAATEPAKEEPAVKAPVATESAKQEPVVQAAAATEPAKEAEQPASKTAAAAETEETPAATTTPTSAARELRARQPAPAAKQLRAVDAAPAAAEVETPEGRASIASSSLDDLAQVKGLNRKLAQAIIKARPFSSFEELIKVRGIGPRMLGALRPFLKL